MTPSIRGSRARRGRRHEAVLRVLPGDAKAFAALVVAGRVAVGAEALAVPKRVPVVERPPLVLLGVDQPLGKFGKPPERALVKDGLLALSFFGCLFRFPENAVVTLQVTRSLKMAGWNHRCGNDLLGFTSTHRKFLDRLAADKTTAPAGIGKKKWAEARALHVFVAKGSPVNLACLVLFVVHPQFMGSQGARFVFARCFFPRRVGPDDLPFFAVVEFAAQAVRHRVFRIPGL